MRTLPSSTDVVVVGAGPTGLVLGCVLAARGIEFVLVDRLAEGLNTSRAAAIHARTLEVLDELDVTQQLRAQGHAVSRFTVRDRDRVLATLRFDRLQTRYPHVLMIPQQVTEAIFLARLQALGGDVRRPYTVERLRQDAATVKVDVADADHRIHTITARYLVGADGMRSTVREQAGIGFSGDQYEQSFVLADVRMRWPLGHDEAMIFFSPAGLVVVAPLPGERHRIVATVDDAPEHPSRADVEALLYARGPAAGTTEIDDVVWSSRFRVHHRLADRYRLGRIVLAGDAAHVHSPAGGQGMNTGIQDAVVLGHALASALTTGSEGALERYEETRRPVAGRVVAFTDRMTKMATVRSARGRAIRNAAIGVLGHTAAPRWLAQELAGLRHR